MTVDLSIEQRHRLRGILAAAVFQISAEMTPAGRSDEPSEIGSCVVAELISLAVALCHGHMSEATFMTAARLAAGEVEWGEDPQRTRQ